MNLARRTFLTSLVCLVAATTVLAQGHRNHPLPKITGVYGDFTVGKGSGDLEGTRVVLFNAGNAYHAIVQMAEGGAEDPAPQYVDVVTVKGATIEFAIGDRKFKGTVSLAGLKLSESGDAAQMLRRKPCSAFL